MPTSTIERCPKRPKIAAAEACSSSSFCTVISVIYLKPVHRFRFLCESIWTIRRITYQIAQIACQSGANMIVLGSARRHQGEERERLTMPTLFRLLAVIAILVGAVYGGLYALAHFVQPKPREISVTVPPDKFFKDH